MASRAPVQTTVVILLSVITVMKLLRVIVRENHANLNGRGSGKILHTNTTDSLGGLMDKYTRDSSLSVLVLEIQASLSVTPVGAISTPKFGQVS